ncbi:MAG: hypothetical protein JXK07_10265 [Spirochaetes bacterium]|nr:hypothetical protein [Spirochaetota bacterium]
MILGEPLLITQLIARIFQRFNIDYMIAGSLASSLHGIPRATHDVDIVADIKLQHVEELIGALKNDFYIDQDLVKKAIKQSSSFNIIHLETMFKIDIFILGNDPNSKSEMDRRQSYQISETSNIELFLASAEDIIIRKLQWFELSNRISDRQWKDVIGVLSVKKDQLDYDYLDEAARQWKVTELLELAMEEVEKN